MDWSFGDVLLTMLAFFFWFTFVWMFVGVFADIFRREDLSGWGKAGWLAVIVIMPFFGVLIYMISRPKSEADMQIFERDVAAALRELQPRGSAHAGASAGDERNLARDVHACLPGCAVKSRIGRAEG